MVGEVSVFRFPPEALLATSDQQALDVVTSRTLLKAGVIGYQKNGIAYVLHPSVSRARLGTKSPNCGVDQPCPTNPPSGGGGGGGGGNDTTYYGPPITKIIADVTAVSYFTFSPTVVSTSYNGGDIGGTGGYPVMVGPKYHLQTAPNDCTSSAVKNVGIALAGIAGAILTSGAYTPAVAAAASGFIAGTVEGVVFAGIIIAELPVVAVAALCLAVALSVIVLFDVLACYNS